MADVDMTDAPTPSTNTQAKKTSTNSKGGKGEEKKRFEVKKVCEYLWSCCAARTMLTTYSGTR